jgi:ribose 1,5-bisphosphate isomerase
MTRVTVGAGEDMHDPVRVAAQKISRLEIQGARNVAIAAIKAVEDLASQSKAKAKKEFLAELSRAKKTLFLSRETEPLMRNAIRMILDRVGKTEELQVGNLAKTVSIVAHQFLADLEESKEKIVKIGVKRIKNNSVILTHCHSSTVTCMLRKAKQNGIGFQVVCTETRPVFQGRVTAKEMLDAGIKATLIVDSAARFFMNHVDLVIVGADAITSEGNVINKIGTSAVALFAHEARTPFYVVSELLKFDPATMYGDYEKIEERSASEVWKDAPTDLEIRNPAFDVTRRDFIHGIICEEGIISPHSIAEVMQRKYPWIFE